MAFKVRILKGSGKYWGYKVQQKKFFFWKTVSKASYLSTAERYFQDVVASQSREWQTIKTYP